MISKIFMLTDQREEAGITIATLKHTSHKFCKIDKPAAADYSGEKKKLF